MSNRCIIVLFLLTLGLSGYFSSVARGADSPAARGKGLVAKGGCLACHQIRGEGAQVGPDLSYEGDKRDKSWLIAHFKNPQSVSPNSIMPPVTLADPDLNDLTAYMLSLTKNAK
jgi:ubiquinol-cytochrome c reductase cytochrome b subunit